MISYITHMRVRPENAAAFEEAVAEMTFKVQQNEPGVVFYGSFKSADDAESYVVVEVYRDAAAFEAHWQTDYIKSSLAKTKRLVKNGTFDIKRYEGF